MISRERGLGGGGEFWMERFCNVIVGNTKGTEVLMAEEGIECYDERFFSQHLHLMIISCSSFRGQKLFPVSLVCCN